MVGSLKTPSVMFSEQVMLDAFLRRQGKEHTSVLAHHQYKSHLFHFLFDLIPSLYQLNHDDGDVDQNDDLLLYTARLTFPNITFLSRSDFFLRYESSTLILYKELSSPIFPL